MKINIGQQIDEVKRELAMRDRVYPGLVSRKKITQAQADYCTQRMQAVLHTLEWLQKNEEAIKGKLAP